MQPTTTEQFEHFSWESPFGVSLVVVLALALLAVCGWALRRESPVIGTRLAVVFWCLRAVALLIVIWMLLAPTRISHQRSTTRQTIAVVTDVSRSMATVDPAGTTDELRWALAAGDATATATSAADRALAAAGIAERHVQHAARALREHRAESHVRDAAVAARTAIEHVRSHLERVVEKQSRWAPQDAADERGPIEQAANLLALLEGPEFKAFADLAKALERGRTPSQQGWRESLPDLEHRLAGIRRRLAELARTVAAGERALLVQEQQATLSALSQATRLGHASAFLSSVAQRVLEPLRAEADVRYSVFDQTLMPLHDQAAPLAEMKQWGSRQWSEDDSTGLTTNVAAVLEELQRARAQQPLAAVIMTTDMIHNAAAGLQPRELAAALAGTPVYIVPIGNTQHVRDVVLQAVTAPHIAMRNDDVVIEATLQAFDCAGESCIVELLQAGEVLERRQVDFDSEVATRTVRFETRVVEVGVHPYQVAVTPLEGELTDENNFEPFEVNVTRSEIKILLADEMPRWEHRYLSQLFRRAAKIECDELLFRPRMIATGKREATKTFPVTVDEWDQYDVVILGDVAAEHLPVASQESLVEYLRERGGTLVLIAGHESMPQAFERQPLHEILPVQPLPPGLPPVHEFSFYVTERGRDHNALMIAENAEATRLAWDFVNRNAPLHSLSNYRLPLPTARTLIGAVPRSSGDSEAAAQQSAFLCWQPVKRGRVVYFSGGETYRLRFLRGDRLHYRLWGQLLRWAIASDLAAGSQRVRIRSDKSQYKRTETVQVVVRLADEQGLPVLDAAVEAVATRADEQRVVIPLVADEEIPGQYRGQLARPEPGVYRLEPRGADVERLLQGQEQLTDASASFTVRADVPSELLDTRADLALAQQIADATGGQVLPPTAVEEVLSLTNLAPQVVEKKMEKQPLWVQWKLLWIVFGCLQAEWIVRKWKGLS